MRVLSFCQTNVFIDENFPFSGNQLATFWDLTEGLLKSSEMQGITQEMNHSESTFVFPAKKADCVRNVRIFTPAREVPFAGHPTLGTAYVLRTQGIITKNQANLELGIGSISINFREDNHIEMEQREPKFLGEFPDLNAIAKILGISPDQIENRWPMQFVTTGLPILIVPIISLDAIRSIDLDSTLLLKTLDDYPAKELVVITSEPVNKDSHAHVRMFAPSAGVFEDPATGSAAGPIGAYLETHQILHNHKKGEEIILEQGYEIFRPSQLFVKCQYIDETISKIIVGGKVKLTAQGQFFL